MIERPWNDAVNWLTRPCLFTTTVTGTASLPNTASELSGVSSESGRIAASVDLPIWAWYCVPPATGEPPNEFSGNARAASVFRGVRPATRLFVAITAGSEPWVAELSTTHSVPVAPSIAAFVYVLLPICRNSVDCTGATLLACTLASRSARPLFVFTEPTESIATPLTLMSIVNP